MVVCIYVIEYFKGQHSSLKHLVQMLLKKGKLYFHKYGERVNFTLSKDQREEDMENIKLCFWS